MTPLKPSLMDRMLASVAPSYATRRYNARLAFYATGQYAGARSDRTALKAWRTSAGSADTDSIGDLPTLRARSRDLLRNNPIAGGALNTTKTNVVGSGLKVRSKVDHELLGIDEAAADKWERRAEKLFHLWAKSKLSDISRTQNFYEQQGLVWRAVFESGDTFVLRRVSKSPRSIVKLALNVIEADRVDTPPEQLAADDVRMGVRLDEAGAPISYYVLNEHPAEAFVAGSPAWREIPAYGAVSGEQMVLHVYERVRPGLTRGVPSLAPVIEPLKQLDRFTEAELMKAVVSSFFTVFLKTATNDGIAGIPGAVPNLGKNEVAMGPGTILDIGQNEDVVTAQSQVNANFDPFFAAVVRQIGVALGIPYELLVMHFIASYSASRAALEMAAQFFRDRREWLVTSFCAPVYEWFLIDAINAGLLEAPGFFSDPVRRAAWLGAEWIGPTRIILDPLKEWKADQAAVAMGARTIEQVIIEKTGSDFETTTAQRIKEHAARFAGGLEPETLTPDGSALPPPAEKKPEGDDGE